MPTLQKPFPNVECEWVEERIHMRLGGGLSNIGIKAELTTRTWAQSFNIGALICGKWKPCAREKQDALCPPLMHPFLLVRCRA